MKKNDLRIRHQLRELRTMIDSAIQEINVEETYNIDTLEQIVFKARYVADEGVRIAGPTVEDVMDGFDPVAFQDRMVTLAFQSAIDELIDDWCLEDANDRTALETAVRRELRANVVIPAPANVK